MTLNIMSIIVDRFTIKESSESGEGQGPCMCLWWWWRGGGLASWPKPLQGSPKPRPTMEDRMGRPVLLRAIDIAIYLTIALPSCAVAWPAKLFY